MKKVNRRSSHGHRPWTIWLNINDVGGRVQFDQLFGSKLLMMLVAVYSSTNCLAQSY